MLIRGTDRGETLTGGAGADTIYGLGGDDTLIGGGGNDDLYGGNGNDLLVASAQGYLGGGAGNDILHPTAARDLSAGGDDGDDLAILSGARSAYTILDDGRGRFRIYGADTRFYLDGIERFRFADWTLAAADLVQGATIIGTTATM
ncbi:calcium-binding protein [Sphingomonas sp. MMS24-JH45]